MVDHEIAFADFAQIEKRLQDLNIAGRMNILFSEGSHLFVFRDRNGYNGLCYTRRQAPFSEVSLEDEDWKVDLATEKSPDQRGYVIATKALTNEVWTSFAPGTLSVFRNGEVVYGGGAEQ